MKNIKTLLTEASIDMVCAREDKWKPNSEFMYLSTDDMFYGFLTKEDIEHLDDYYSPADEDIKAILSLKPGESYFNVNNECHYIRIKK